MLQINGEMKKKQENFLFAYIFILKMNSRQTLGYLQKNLHVYSFT
jgi:hypothetical protein